MKSAFGAPPARRKKQYKVVSVSKNHNAFGLRGHILIAKDGTAFEVGRSIATPGQWTAGQVVEVPEVKLSDKWQPLWEHLGAEIPRQLKSAPPEVIREVWAA